MTESKEPLSGNEGFEIIHEMIAKAKGSIRDGSFYFLMWGWLIISGSMGHYLLLEFSEVDHPEWAWLVVVIGIIASFVKGFKDRGKKGTSLYSSRIYTTVWITFLVNYFILIFFMAKINFYITPLVLIMAASSTYLSGAIIKFSPLKWGAIFIWLMAILSFSVILPYQLLATTAAVLFGYLVPGYILKNQGG